MKDKKIGVVHLVYGCIIALLIITFTLAIAFGGNKDAGNQMNVMATGISVVLAVIAILMTLVDVAGQRQSIIEIKETAEKLMEFQELAQDKITELLRAMSELDEIKSIMKNNTVELQNYTERLIKENSETQGTMTQEKLEEFNLKLNEKLKELNGQLIDLDTKRLIEGSSNEKKKAIYEFRKWVKRTFPKNARIEFSIFLDSVYDSFNMNEIKYILSYLRESGATITDNEVKLVDVNYIKGVPPQYF
ncbi:MULTISPECIES: hypothetical protein [unclassified Bacillus (in: firmicutes)]|uniref:hypothetical protein n=1 Tax=unclassified Bacillus (in: firmicutes) TaxID=185979 RepID=UPI001158CA65|nr:MULTISPECIES: hypothetical protein [unclassified Bacillus (in: firmicutes)]